MTKRADDLKIGDCITIKGFGGLDWNTLKGEIISIADNGGWITAFVDDGKTFTLPSGKVVYKDVALDKDDEVEVA